MCDGKLCACKYDRHLRVCATALDDQRYQTEIALKYVYCHPRTCLKQKRQHTIPEYFEQ